VLIDARDDVASRPLEAERVILNFHVDDARALAAHLDGLGVTCWCLSSTAPTPGSALSLTL
jgi:hypothetical protein